MTHAAIAAVPKAGTPQRDLMQDLLVKRYAYFIADGEDPTAFDPRGEDSTPQTLCIGYNSLLFWLDPLDALTGHDGTTCIVTFDGSRYKTNGVDLLTTWVIDVTLTAPPTSPLVDGDAYLVAAAATGDWAGFDDYIAVWVESRSSWFFIAPKPGWFVWTADADGDVPYHYDSVTAAWVQGFGPGLLVDKTVPVEALVWDERVENQTTTAPPATWSKGAAYIIGASATGDWVGQDTKLAVAYSDGVLAGGDTFQIITPWDGLRAYDKALGDYYQWDATAVAWKQSGGRFRIKTTIFNLSDNLTLDADTFGIMVHLAGGGGGGGGNAGSGLAGTNSSFGGYLIANGGAGGSSADVGGAGGTGGGGSITADLRLPGEQGGDSTKKGYGLFGGRCRSPYTGYGRGGGSSTKGSGGGGEYVQHWLKRSEVTSIVTVTVGTGGSFSTGGERGVNGVCVVEEYIPI